VTKLLIFSQFMPLKTQKHAFGINRFA